MKKLLLLFLFTNISLINFGWGFTRNHNHTTPDIGTYRTEISNTKTYYVGNTNQNDVYLTFDVGYDNGNLSKILDILESRQVRATFFLTGDFVNRYEELVVRLSLSNHLICNHSYAHKSITKLTKEELKQDISKLESKYNEITGKRLSPYFRPPAGDFNKDSLKNVNDLGYVNVFWSMAWVDWYTDNQKGAKYSFDSYVKNLHPGAIVLLHSVSESNKDALNDIIDYTINNGYSFKTIDEIKNEF